MELQIIQNKIFEVRGYRVMLDFHLAELYNVKTKVLKQAVKRNIQRFPSDFMFELDKEEFHQLVTNCDQFPETLKHSSVSPMVFTEQGVAMLSTVLRSQTAIDVNISIMRAFVLMRQMVIGYDELLKRIEELEESTDAQFSEIYQALTQLLSKPDPKPRNPIGYRIPDEEK
ncbi:ORF6N domain-containing protein [Porphyromonadaceae bacterium]